MAAGLPRLGVVYAPRGPATLRDIVRAFRDLAEPVIVLPPGDGAESRSLEAAARRLFGTVLTCTPAGEPTDPAAVRAAGLTGVVTFNDSELERASTFAGAVGVPRSNAPDVADKLYQRTRLGESGLTRIGAVAVDSAADLTVAVKKLGLPAVLKPRRGVGGSRVRVLREPGDVAGVPGVVGGMMLEQYIPDDTAGSLGWLADYVSVEACSTGSGHHVLAVFGKLPVATVSDPDGPATGRMVTTGDVLPNGLPLDMYDEVVLLVMRSLQAFGLRDSLSHTEVKLGADGPEIIETNCRLGGHLSRLTSRWCGLDLVRLGAGLALGDATIGVPGVVPTGETAVAGVFVPFDPRSGDVRSNASATDVRSLPGVRSVDELARPGRPRTDTDGIVANVVLEAADLDQLRSVLRAYLADLSTLFASDGIAGTQWVEAMTEELAR